MANKRQLKKQVEGICGVLMAECFAVAMSPDKKEKENVENIMKAVLTVNSNYTKRISHPEPGMAPKEYFRDLVSSFNKEVEEIIDSITSLN